MKDRRDSSIKRKTITTYI